MKFPFLIKYKEIKVQYSLSLISYMTRTLSLGGESICSGNHCMNQDHGPRVGWMPVVSTLISGWEPCFLESPSLCGSRGQCVNERSSREI